MTSLAQTDRPSPLPARGGPRRRRRVLKVLGAIVLVLVLLLGLSVGRALTAPGTDSTAARLAEWGRGHGLSAVIDRLERATYKAPAVGGAPAGDSPLVTGGETPSAAPKPDKTPALASIVPLVSPALPGEGNWKPLSIVNGKPALQQAFLRPDATHTGYTAGVAWMDPTLLRFVLHPGTQEPGHGPWTVPPALGPADRTGLLAAFNGGFRLDAARGGFYAEGRTVGTLRVGAASLVIDSAGRAQIGQWGRDVSMSPDVAAVRQNLDLLVDQGQVAAGLDGNDGGRWGATLGNKLYVWRSGVGQTATGALVYVAGDRLSASTLAELLRRAGAVRAMELDINPEWTSFVSYPETRNLLPDMQRLATRYDTTSSRDFFAVLSR